MSVRGVAKKLFPWLLALTALVFVIGVVPVRDRCRFPEAGIATRVPRVDDESGCTLQRKSAPPVRLSLSQCRALDCEPGLVSTLAGARASWLLAMLALYVLGSFAWAVRWRELLRLARLPLPISFVWRVTLEAQAGGILLPGGVGGDALRVASIAGRGVPTPTVIASVLLDRVIGLTTLAMVAGVLGLAGGGAGGEQAKSVASLSLALALFPLVPACGLWIARRPSTLKLFQTWRFSRLTRDAAEYLAEPGAIAAIARSVVASLAVSIIQLLVVRGCVTALMVVPLEPRWVYTGTAMSFMVAAVPALPGGWGTSDAAFVFFLGLAGVSPQAALSVCLLYRAFWYLLGVVGAGLRLARSQVPQE